MKKHNSPYSAKEKYKPQKYETPLMLGEKMQLGVIE